MKITRIMVWHVPLRSHVEYRMAAGKTCATIDTVVVRLETDAGIDGWGEVCPIPHYLPAFADGVVPAIADLATLTFRLSASLSMTVLSSTAAIVP